MYILKIGFCIVIIFMQFEFPFFQVNQKNLNSHLLTKKQPMEQLLLYTSSLSYPHVQEDKGKDDLFWADFVCLHEILGM